MDILLSYLASDSRLDNLEMEQLLNGRGNDVVFTDLREGILFGDPLDDLLIGDADADGFASGCGWDSSSQPGRGDPDRSVLLLAVATE